MKTKRGRPTKPAKQRARNFLPPVRMTDAELARITLAVERAQVRQSEWVRRTLLAAAGVG